MPRMKRILLIQPTTCDTWTRFLDGVYDFARGQDWMFLSVRNSPSAVSLKQQIQHWNPDGCIVDCMSGRGFHPEVFKSLSVPVIYLNHPESRSRDSQFSVCEDSEQIVRLALNHLCGLGCAHLAFVRHPENPEWALRRLEAFKRFAREARIPISILSSEDAASPKQLARLPSHTGILGCCDQIAQVALQSVIMNKRRIPDDLAILGIDNEPVICEAQAPGLSSISVNRFKAGRLLGELLAQRMSSTSATPRTVYYGPEGIQIRGSTRLLRTTSSKIQVALEFIRANACNGRLGIDDVAKKIGYARTRTATLFRQATGKSILEEINDIRLEEARRLLTNSTFTISEIIAACGYSSAAFLSKAFRRRTGMTMRQYRAAHAPK